jgi:hypothetical protein
MSSNTKGKLMYARNYLADLYEEIGDMPEAVGRGFAQHQVSDAIDRVDAALHALPAEPSTAHQEEK